MDLSWLNHHPAFWPAFIFAARVVDVSFGTLRTICTVRGLRTWAPILGFFEVTVWLLAVSGVITHLNHWYNILAYAGGFAAGNATGMFIEQKLAIGTQMIRFISRNNRAAVTAGLRFAGYAVTEIKGQGMQGTVSIAFVVAPRKEAATVIQLAHGIDSDVVCTVEDVRSATAFFRRSLP